MRRLMLLSVLVLPMTFVSADDPKKSDDPPAPTPKQKTDPTAHEVKFADGSTIRLNLMEVSLVVSSKYGKLTVPMSEVKRIEFGFRYPEGMKDKVEAVVADLSSGEFKARDKASKEILTYGEFALPALKRAMKSDSPEAVRRATEALRKLEETLPKEILELREYDVLHTADGPVRGTVETPGFKAKTKYFGETTLKLADIRDLRAVGAGGSDQFNLEAGKYAKLRWAAWHDTGFEMSGEEALEVTASGKIDQWPQSPGQYPCGPNGSTGFVMGPDAGPGGFPGGPGGQFKSGALYGKIGEKGTPFLIGESYKGRPTEKGKLYVIIAPSHWGNENCTGEYSLKVKIGG